ncbi:MAG: hypothetical protein MJ052_00865 [Sphaerochaetaceae bacterium]|nr:hypothetical protein [Sphaerochaetaceae bacterium]
MKRFFCVFTVLFVSVFIVAAVSLETGRRNEAMGGVFTAQTESEYSTFANPASLFFYDRSHRFVIETGIGEGRPFGSKPPFPAKPEFFFRGQFIGKGMALALGMDYQTGNCDYRPSPMLYNFVRNIELNVLFSLGYKNFSFGAGIFTLTGWINDDVEIRPDHTFIDLLTNGFFSFFLRDSSQLQVSLRAGMQYRFGRLSAGFLFRDILTYNSETTKLSFARALENISGGIFYQGDTYTKRGRLNKVIPAFGVEVQGAASVDKMTINSGAEVKLQFAKQRSFAMRLGYYGRVKDYANGNLTLGLGAMIGVADISFTANLPIPVIKRTAADGTVTVFRLSAAFLI